MDSIRLSVDTSSEGIEIVCAALNDIGFEQLEIVDDLDSIRADLKDSAEFWDYVDENSLVKNGGQTCVCAYFVPDEESDARILAAKERMGVLKEMDLGLDLGSLEIHQETIREEDWRNNWRQFYKPLEIGERLMVVPDWERESAEDNERVKLYLEPGLVFGTGEHQTTQLCLEALEKTIEQDDTVLDVGSGSGILSITALLLGAKSARAVDIDQSAKRIAYENADLNQIDKSKYDVLIGNALSDEDIQKTIENDSYDLIVANIVADVIINLAPLAQKWIREGGTFISSGIIDEREKEVETAIVAAGFAIISRSEKDDWVCFVARAGEKK